MEYDTAIKTLEAAFRLPLPGGAAQDRLAPRPRREWPPEMTPGRIRTAAGLLLMFPLDTRAFVVLTVRGQALGRHGGQVSLPGGAVEPGETLEEAALREAQEEIGADGARVRILGALTPVDIPVSGFRLHPFVAAAPERLLLFPADGEVARILEVDVDDLLHPGAVSTNTIVRDGRTLVVPSLTVGDDVIWGATAMVLAEFLAVLSR